MLICLSALLLNNRKHSHPKHKFRLIYKSIVILRSKSKLMMHFHLTNLKVISQQLLLQERLKFKEKADSLIETSRKRPMLYRMNSTRFWVNSMTEEPLKMVIASTKHLTNTIRKVQRHTLLQSEDWSSTRTPLLIIRKQWPLELIRVIMH
jgi:hypothetical protein